MARIFVDLDGTVTDFEAGCLSALGMSRKDFVQAHGDKVLWKRLAAVPDFYANLPWCAEGQLFLSQLRAVIPFDALLLTLAALPLGDWAAPQRRAWVAANTPGLAVLCCQPRDMATYCNTGDVLISTNPDLAVPCREGGVTFVLHTGRMATVEAMAGWF